MGIVNTSITFYDKNQCAKLQLPSWKWNPRLKTDYYVITDWLQVITSDYNSTSSDSKKFSKCCF